MRARKNVTFVIEFLDSEDSDVENFINSDTHQHFTDYFVGMSVHIEMGFTYNLEE